MKTLIFGASGLLGKALMHELEGTDVVGLSSRNVDLRNAHKVQEAVEGERPDWVLLVAAYTDVDGCENHDDQAFSVNRDGAVHVAEAAKKAGAKLLFVSSDYVFDGKKTTPYEAGDTRNPQSVYGRSKAEAEILLQDTLPGCCIVRTSWLFGTGGKCFPDTILKLAANRPVLDVVNDQKGCPTYAIDLAKAIVGLSQKDAKGIIHVTNTGACSWFEFASEIIKQEGLSTPIRPVTTEQMARPAKRPQYSVLSDSTMRRWGILLPNWQDALGRYLQARKIQTLIG